MGATPAPAWPRRGATTLLPATTRQAGRGLGAGVGGQGTYQARPGQPGKLQPSPSPRKQARLQLKTWARRAFSSTHSTGTATLNRRVAGIESSQGVCHRGGRGASKKKNATGRLLWCTKSWCCASLPCPDSSACRGFFLINNCLSFFFFSFVWPVVSSV